MERAHPPRKHVWADSDTPQQITQDGEIFFHHRCARCGRDFVQPIDGTDWLAASAGGSANRASCGQRDRAMGDRGMPRAVTGRRQRFSGNAKGPRTRSK